MKIQNLTEKASDFTGNVWLIENDGETVLIDAGTGDSWDEIKELEKIDELVITHSHYDHVDNLPKIEDMFSPEIYSYEPENLPVKASKINEKETIRLAGLDFEVFHTPGHKDDSICLYSPEKKVIFTGDLVFPDRGFGRTDLDEGDRDLLIDSIRKLEGLEIDEMYSGHGEAVKEDAGKSISESLEEAEKKEPKY